MTIGSSRENEQPGSRRGLCLGCDARVVTARDAHVLFGGTRDGSVLAMFDAAPLLMLATDPDRLFEPGLELLGVAHRSCADLARQRLEAHQVDLPDELPQLIADEAVGDLPALHLPPTASRCAFCGDTEVSDEHVWPKWISRRLGGRHGFIISSPHGPRLRRHLGMTAPVCMTCNNRWLSVLEKDLQPILGPLISGEERSLSPDEQRLLATWAVKTALMLDLGSDQPVIPTGFYHDLRLRRCPLPSYSVWIGAYRDWHYAAWGWHGGLRLGISADESPNGFVSTFTAFRVVFQVFGHFTRGGAQMDDRRPVAAALAPIWPPQGRPIDWPPNRLAFGDDSLAELAQSIKG